MKIIFFIISLICLLLSGCCSSKNKKCIRYKPYKTNTSYQNKIDISDGFVGLGIPNRKVYKKEKK